MVTPSHQFWAGRRVLLTGHTGFKGAWCARWLSRLGADVFGLSLPPEEGQTLWEASGRPGDHAVGFGDIRDADQVAGVFARVQPNIVLHMAAQALVHRSYDDPKETFDTNVMGLVHILDAARATQSVRAIVNVTSDKCYENREQVWAYRENEPMGGSDPYSASKGCSELVTASYRRSFFSRGDQLLASGRAGNVIGGGDWSRDRLIPDCVRAFTAGQAVSIRNRQATRPWQHVLEPLSGYLLLAQALVERGNEVADGWNFGPPDDDAWHVGRVADTLVSLWGDGASWHEDENAWPHEAMLLRVDATKARVGLGWRPRLDTATALAWTIEWYRAVLGGASAQGIVDDQIARFEQITSRNGHPNS